MSKKRFDYLEPEIEPTRITSSLKPPSSTPSVAVGHSLPPKRSGRMQLEREQLNVRVSKDIKRKALTKAMLEGKTLGEVVEALLLEWME